MGDGWLYTLDVKLAWRAPGLDVATRDRDKLRAAIADAMNEVVGCNVESVDVGWVRCDPSNFPTREGDD